MTTELVLNEIAHFLSGKEPAVLCIRGKWGVGKTFAWRKQLEEALRTPNGIGLDRYAYVSVFGINSVEELKYAIFEHTLPKSQVLEDASISSLSDLLGSAEGWGRKGAWLANLVPGLRTYLATAAPAFFLAVRNQVICIDDLERSGQKLDVGDLLGLVSFLKEQRKCKIALLLNDEQLNDKAKFETHLEKVVDVSLVYAPSSQESVDAVLSAKDPVSNRVAELCTKLGVSNIRVIKKIEQTISSIRQMVDKYDNDVFLSISSSVALFVWSHMQPGEAPTIDFLKNKRSESLFGFDVDEEQLSPQEAAWNAVLNEYGYIWTDDLDATLIDGVLNGYFDPIEIDELAKAQHDKHEANKVSDKFDAAWRLYHDSFADNQNDVLDQMFDSFKSSFTQITPLNLNGTVQLFKRLGRDAQAAEMIALYVQGRNEDRTFFDLSANPFLDAGVDQDVAEAFRTKAATLEPKREVSDLLMSIKDGWDQEVLTQLSTTPIGEFQKAFKAEQGAGLRHMISGALQFDRLGGATPQMLEISRRAREALVLIGNESPINALRVAKYGVKVDP